jgi:hypothetical protein
LVLTVWPFSGAFLLYPVGIPCFYYYQLSENVDALHDEVYPAPNPTPTRIRTLTPLRSEAHPEHGDVKEKLDFLYGAYEASP